MACLCLEINQVTKLRMRCVTVEDKLGVKPLFIHRRFGRILLHSFPGVAQGLLSTGLGVTRFAD